MRHVSVAAFLVGIVLASSTASAATNGHWYCTSDGVKSWTTDTAVSDAHGWTYSGDKAVYKDGGKCEKK